MKTPWRHTGGHKSRWRKKRRAGEFGWKVVRKKEEKRTNGRAKETESRGVCVLLYSCTVANTFSLVHGVIAVETSWEWGQKQKQRAGVCARSVFRCATRCDTRNSLGYKVLHCANIYIRKNPSCYQKFTSSCWPQLSVRRGAPLRRAVAETKRRKKKKYFRLDVTVSFYFNDLILWSGYITNVLQTVLLQA